MSDEELIERLRDWPYQGETMAGEAADRIEALVKADRAQVEVAEKQAETIIRINARAERLEAALRLLHDNVVLAFPTLADLGPVANARAALKGDEHV